MGIDISALGANAGYVVAAYVVTAVILCCYALALWRKSRKGS